MPTHILTAQWRAEMAVIDPEQVVDFAFINLHRAWIAVVFHIGGTDDREFIQPRDHKHNPVVFVLQNISLWAAIHPWHHDVAAFNQPNIARGGRLQAVIKELFYPRAGSIHQCTRPPHAALTTGVRTALLSLHPPQAILTLRAHNRGAGQHLTAFFHHLTGIGHHQTRIIHPAVGIFKTAP